MAHFELFIEKAADSEADLKVDMENMFKEMCNDRNELLIDGFNKNVAEVTPDEEDLYDNLKDFDVTEIRPTLPEHMQNFNQRNLLMHFWRFPSIWIGPIEECTCDKKDFTKIKREFIIKIVPNQILEEIQLLTMKHVERIVKKLKITNKVSCSPVMECSTRPWITSFTSKLYTAARRALIQIYHEEPNVIREDRSRVLLNILEKRLEVPTLVLPLAPKSSNVGEPNENLSTLHYHEGIKVLAAFLYQYSST